MQELIRLIVERAKRTEDRFTLDGKQDAATILAEEVIRLAHLATTSHMLLSAQDKANSSSICAETQANDALQLHLTQQEQAS